MPQTRFDPVMDSQAVFRALMDVTARPGTVAKLPARADDAPGNPWTAAVLLTLCDHETTLAADAGYEDAAAHIRARTGVRQAAIAGAAFVLADACEADSILPQLARGSLSYPDEGATCILEVEALGRGREAIEIAGPGVDGAITLNVDGLDDAGLRARDEAVADYPAGVDLLLIDQTGHIAALPRSSRVARVGRG